LKLAGLPRAYRPPWNPESDRCKGFFFDVLGSRQIPRTFCPPIQRVRQLVPPRSFSPVFFFGAPWGLGWQEFPTDGAVTTTFFPSASHKRKTVFFFFSPPLTLRCPTPPFFFFFLAAPASVQTGLAFRIGNGGRIVFTVDENPR